MKRIKQLSINVINQIAAGEVIERPANVVKELVENSIDAGANKIEINITNECRNIRVADNGSGIHPDDIELAFSKHATSKLTDEEGLFNISTLGFRGEALASMISVAKVTCTTRTKEFDYGTKAEAKNSEVEFSKIGCAQGTIMEVNDLFYNQPVRLKFLKNSKTEFSYIQEYVQALAISNPQIGFILKNNNNTIINTTPNCDLLLRISQIYSKDIINNLKEVKRTDEIEEMSITGYVSIPSYTRASKKSIYTFVNSRVIKCPILLKAIDTAYRNMMPTGRYPFVVINIEMKPSDIDINAHPTKKEIRYKNANQIFNFVKTAIEYSLSSQRNDFSTFENIEEETNLFPFIKEKDNTDDDEVKDIIIKDEISEERNKITENTRYYEEVEEERVKQNKIEFEIESPIKEEIKIVGQYKNTYILVENEDNIEIIDQHIADERYIYENLKKEKQIASQLLIVSDVLDIEPTDAEILANAREQLGKFGYQIERISDKKIIFKKIPQILSHIKPSDILSELLKNLRHSRENDLDTIEERILITTSCKAAIKAGEKLTLWQMENVVRKLRTTKNPYTCPHGRPISHYIEEKEIASFFARNI